MTFITDLDPDNPNEVCFTTEFFGAVLGVVRLPGVDAGSYLRNAVEIRQRGARRQSGRKRDRPPRDDVEALPGFQ